MPVNLEERTRLAGHKQRFSNLLRQNGRHVTKVYNVPNSYMYVLY